MKSLSIPTMKIQKVTKSVKIGVAWGIRGHPKSSKTSPFYRAHMNFYSTLIGTMRLSRTVFTAQGYAKRGICRRRVSVCLSVYLSHSGIVSKRLNVGSRKQRRMIAP